MTKEVKITVKGIQQDDTGESNGTETVAAGEYYFRNGSHYIFYTETAEGSGESTRNSLKLKGDILELTRKGAQNSRMVFETGKRHAMDYATPFGVLRMETAASGIRLLEEEKNLRIGAEYELWADDMKVSSHRLTIDIEPL